MAEIFIGTFNGSNTWYGLTNKSSTFDGVALVDKENLFINIDEDDSAYLLEWIFDKYYDKKINMYDSLEHWGENYFEILIARKVLEEIDEICKNLKSQDQNSRIEINGCRNYFCYEAVDFYEKFILLVTNILDENPDYKYFVVSGP